jgi:pyruvate/2-oxoglutarate dehydrogenase complex dihydrolipoamide acyltransferase (E2) component
MVTNVIMPKLAANVNEATIGQWFKSEGERVTEGELLFEAITDKAAVEVKAEGDGVLRTIIASENSVVPVGQTIGLIAEPDDELPEVEAPSKAPSPQAATSRVKASFGARRLAKQLGVDLADVRPGRADGRITEDDVRRTAEEGPAPEPREGPPVREVRPLSPVKRALAEHLTHTARHVAPAFVSLEVDCSAVRAALPAVSEAAGVKPRPRDVLIHLAARLLPEHPLLNACFTDDGIVVYDPIHIGLALDVERDDAVLVPVVRDANEKSLAQIARETAHLEQRLRSHELAPEDFTGATFTITDQSHLNIDSFVPILAERQSAILALSTIRRRPVVREESLHAAPVANLAVAFDHRVLNGTTAARFLNAMRQAIESFDPNAG